jgi:tetratricopeptide (TPR) repeat protein
MAAESDDPTRESLLDEILTGYLKSLDDGQTPDRAGLLARYPELAAEMAEFFAEQDRFASWTEPLRPVARAARLETPAAEATAGNGQAPAPATSVGSFGDYELLRVLGQGGMGVVYEARHRPLNRVVALKMIPAGRWASETDVHRFRNEAEAVAHLDHPHIVPIYDVGEHDGQPYFAMKLIEGGSLAPVGVRGQESGIRGQTPREAARLVAVVARAVHHAHQRGILHRDLKPSNVLLDAAGRPYVTDFGLAKRLHGSTDDSLTQPGALVGTPGYVAPEQATTSKGAATVASDVYGLGAILYALLTGGPPFRGDDLLDTLEQVWHREPEPPRKCNPLIDRDLELICLKCLEKDPRRRYPSAEALAEELDRYLDGLPLACTRPVGGAERLWRWYLRNVVLASLGMAAALSLAAVAVVSVVAAFRLAAVNEQERLSRAEAVESRQLAVESVNRFFKKVSENKGLRTHGQEPVLKELLADAKELYEQLLRVKGGDPAVEAQRGQATLGLAQITADLGDSDEAVRLFQQARATFERLTHDHPVVSAHQVSLVTALHQLGRQYQLGGQDARARQAYDKVLSLLEPLLRQAPDDPDLQDRQARTYQNLGTLYLNARPLAAAAAQANYDKALPIRERLARDHPANVEFQNQLAETLHTRGTWYRKQGLWAKAKANYDRAFPIRTMLADAHKDVPGYRNELATLLHAQAEMLQKLRQWDEAKAALAAALALREKLADEHRAVPFYRAELGAVYYDAACLNSLSSAAALKDAKLSPGRRQELAEEQAAHAVGMLMKARATGFFNKQDMLEFLRRGDADLEPLRARKDFRELLIDLDKEAAGAVRERSNCTSSL